MKRLYVEAPERSQEIDNLYRGHCLFLAGSITGAKDWQKEIIDIPVEVYGKKISIREVFHVFNPRRKEFDVTKKDVEKEQITWEYEMIHKCRNILFWFSHETLAPITLFEYGSALNTHQHRDIFVGVDPEYKRKNDVIIQTALRDVELANKIVFSLEDLAETVIASEFPGFKGYFQSKTPEKEDS